MNSRKSAKAIPSTLNRFLKSRALLKSPPPSFYPLAANPPPPSLIRSFPTRDQSDLPYNSPNRISSSPTSSQLLNEGIRSSSSSSSSTPPTQGTRRKPPRKQNTRYSRPEAIVFPQDKIRSRFYQDHPFEAYRPINLVEADKVTEASGPQGKEWTELRQRTLNPSPEDCIDFIHNLTTSHSLPYSQAYTHGITSYRTLRSEHETSTLSARLESESHGATFFGEIEKSVLVEEKVLDQWINAKEIQDSFAVSGGPGAVRQQSTTVGSNQGGGGGGVWSPSESRPAQLGGGAAGGEAIFTGGVEYLKGFEKRGGATEGAVRREDGALVGSQ